MSFRVNARNIFLTYPQLNISHQVLHDYLQTLADNVYSCVERHQDGNTHFHAICSYEKKKDIRSATYFDFEGHHCNIQACRNLEASVRYIEKDGDVLGLSPHEFKPSRAARLTSLLRDSTTADQFLAGFEEIDPHTFIVHNNQIEDFARKRYRVSTSISIRSRDDFRVPPSLDDWVATNLFPSPERPKCLILVGPTRLGKTEWSRSLGEHTYWSNYVTSERNLSARYAVIDDMENFDRFTARKHIFGCQKVIGLNPKYSRLQQWEWGIPTIWLFNWESLPTELRDAHSYYRQNSIYIEINNPLF